MASLLQPSFAGGELAPSLQGRVDLARYAISLSTCRNFFVLPYGGATTRPGLQYVAAAKHADKTCRLIPFVFNSEQTYVIELGDGYARFHQDGAPVMDGGSPEEIATPWAEADLPLVKWVQSADVLTLLHPDYAPRELSRTSATTFSIATYSPQLGPFRDQNVDESITVTASAETGSVTLTASSGIFSSEHVGTLVQLRQVDMGEVSAWQNRAEVAIGDKRYVDERVYEATEKTNDPGATGVLTGDNTPAHTEGEQWDGPQASVQGISELLGVKWKYLHSGVGVVKITGYTNSTTVTGTVVKRLPETVVTGNTYRWSLAAWDSVRGYPGTATYYQQRLVLGGSIAQPQTFWMSETGIFDGFETNLPLEADDAINFTLASRQVNEIRHLVPLGSLLALTSGAEWQIASGDQGLAPDTVEASAQGYRGTSHLPPLLIGSSALYVQARGTIVRDLTYSFELDGYAGDDLTVFSNHLFRGHTLDDWAYTQEPNSIVWAVRSDGTLLSMTYVREQQVVAWARHDTPGAFESVASVSEGQEDALYAVVKRTISGSTVRYIERLASREFEALEDYFGVDAGLTYDGRNTTTTTLTLSGGTEWKTDETLTLTASAATFDSGKVGRRYRLTVGDDFADVEVTAYTSTTEVSVEPVRLVPEAVRDAATTDWALMATTLSGLDHLEGEEVSIAADGNAAPPKTVTDGSITLDTPAAVAHVGLAIICDLETLPINQTTRSGDNLRGNYKNIPHVGLVLHRSRGVFVARDRKDFEGTGDNLIELKQRDDEDWAESTNLLTGYTRLAIPTGWDQDGRIFVRQSDPLPLTILSIIPEVQLAGKG